MTRQAHHIRHSLQTLHSKTGEMLTLCNRLLATVVTLGSIFCIMMVLGFDLIQHPEQVFHTQAFNFNYSEFSKAQAILQPSDTDELQEQAVRKQVFDGQPNEPKSAVHKDSNWDGALAGLGVGYTVGRTIPLIGCVAGPVFGAFIGYRLDDRI